MEDNPARVDMVNLTSFAGFYTSQVVIDGFPPSTVRRVILVSTGRGNAGFLTQRGPMPKRREGHRQRELFVGRGFLVLNLAPENFSVPKGKARLSRIIF